MSHTQVVACSFCNGERKVVRLEEQTFSDGEWYPHKQSPPMNLEVADAMCNAYPNLIRWQVVDCPQCDGIGEYTVEFTPCKIF